MTSKWMRGAAAAVAMACAMLAGAADATVITYNFSGAASSYYDSQGNYGGVGTFAGSFQIDTAKLAQAQTSDNYGYYGYQYIYSSDVNLTPVTASTNISGTPSDTLLNTPVANPTQGSTQLFQGTGGYYIDYFGSYFELNYRQNFYLRTDHGDGTFTDDYDSREIGLVLTGATTTTVDGFVVPTPGTGTASAYQYRNRGSQNYTNDYNYLGGTSASANIFANSVQTSAGANAVPEPGALGLLGLGLLGLAVRRPSTGSGRRA